MKYMITALVSFLALNAQASKVYNYQTHTRSNLEACTQVFQISVHDTGAHYQPDLQANDFVLVKFTDGNVATLKYQHSDRRHDSDVAAHALEVYSNGTLTAILERNSDTEYPRPGISEGFSYLDLNNYVARIYCAYQLVQD